MKRSLPGLYGRSLGGVLMTVAHFLFAYHYWRMLRAPRGAALALTRPPFHEAQPLLYTSQASAAGALARASDVRPPLPEGGAA